MKALSDVLYENDVQMVDQTAEKIDHIMMCVGIHIRSLELSAYGLHKMWIIWHYIAGDFTLAQAQSLTQLSIDWADFDNYDSAYLLGMINYWLEDFQFQFSRDENVNMLAISDVNSWYEKFVVSQRAMIED